MKYIGLIFILVMFSVSVFAADKQVEKPTDIELNIFCTSQDELFKKPNVPEKEIDKFICELFKITEKELNQIYIKVMVHYHSKGTNPCKK